MTDNFETFNDWAIRQEQEDQRLARASSLWPTAVAFLQTTLPEDTRAQVKERVLHDPEGWYVGYHFEWGMSIRNLLRQNGFGEQEFGVGNLDNIYVPLVEDAVR